MPRVRRADKAPIEHVPVPRHVFVLAAVWLLAICAVAVVLANGDPQSSRSQLVGNSAFLLALAFCCATCTTVAVRPSRGRLGWTLMAIGMFLGMLGQLGWVLAALSGAAAASSSVAGDVLGYVGYTAPTIAAIFAFPRRSELLISRFRQLLDVGVITIGVVLVGEATVLGPVRALTDTSGLEGALRIAYPISDIAICALVLCLGMRQAAGDRLTWFVLGTGLLVVAITDSVYVRLLASGYSGLTGSALVIGWMLGPVLIGLATFIPMTGRRHRGARDYSLLLQLVPYVPVIGAMVVLSLVSVLDDLFLAACAALLLVMVTVRQVMIVYENVSLTRDLEGKVASRTAELTTLGSIVTSSNDAIVGVDLDGSITAWNPAAEQLYGYPARSVMGRPPDFLMPEAMDYLRQALADARRNEPLRGFEIDWQRPDGSVVPVATTVSRIVDADGVQGISVFGQDITERRRAAEALERAREEALESSRLKSEFLATMSHEIRTPMNGVIGLTTLLLTTDLDDVQRQYGEGVRSAGEALLSVINDILDFSKLEAGKVVLDLSDFSPRRLVEEVGSLLAPAAASKQLELIAFCLPDVPEAVHGDVGRIRQILLNLASNAVKFTTQGEVVVRARASAHDGDLVSLRFEVIDTGIGIAEEDQSRLFESFSQADASTTRRFGGTGLGLAISRRLVEVMGGQIAMESELGVGSLFWFEIQLRTAKAVESEPVELSHDLLNDLRVLVVDDNETNRTILKAQFEAWRMRPDLADSAASAFEKLRRAALQGRPYDLAALDMAMPDVDGLELARRISTDPLLEGLPMILLTSSLQLDAQTMRSAGVNQWLSKPLRSSELFDRLMRLIAPRSPEIKARRSRTVQPAAPASSRGRLLIVEDNALNRLVAERIVARLGYQSDCVTDGRAAVDAVASGRYDAVLMDCHMPTMDGFEATRRIRSAEAGRAHTPIIAMTAGALVEDRERCFAAGMDDHVSKPIDSEVLETALAEFVGRGRPGAGPGVTATDEPTSGAAPGSEGAQSHGAGAHGAGANGAGANGAGSNGAGSNGAGASGNKQDEPLDRSRLEDLAELTGPDGTNLLATMIESYRGHAIDRMHRLEEALEADDFESAASVSHELKGSSGTIGATKVMALAAEIERSARASHRPRPGAIDELRRQLDRATLALSELNVAALQVG